MAEDLRQEARRAAWRLRQARHRARWRAAATDKDKERRRAVQRQ
jgi:hypothetical protein